MADRTATDEYKKAAARVTEEFELLLLGRAENISAKELFYIRDYADRRTDLLADESKLTDTQLVWKKYYQSIDSQLSQYLSASDKKKIDALADVQRAHLRFQTLLKVTTNLLKETEFLFVEQFAYLTVHFNNDEKNKYREEEEHLAKIAADGNAPPDLRVKAAESILKWADHYDKTFISVIKRGSERIYNALQRFEKYLRDLQDMVELLRALGDEGAEGFAKGAAEMESWLSLASDLYKARAMAIFSIERSLETDRMIPNLVIQTQGEQQGNLGKEESQEFMKKIASYGGLAKTASEKEDEIQKKLLPITKQLWPERDEEIEKHAQNYSIASET